MPAFRLKKAEEIRSSITDNMTNQIQKMYQDLYRQVSRRITSGGNGGLSQQNLILLQREIQNRIKQINSELEGNVRANMETVCNAVTEDIRTYLKQMGFSESDIADAYIHIPQQIVETITTGQIYQEGWTLSHAIWGYNQKTQQTLQNIVASGAGQGKSSYEIAKDLESYVNPSAAKKAKTIRRWRCARETDVQAGRANSVGQKITDYFYPGKIDYNALRLARTMVSHAYQQTFERVNRNDPFVTGYRWLTSNFHGRVCSICREREGRVYPKDELPMDHPNGMCTFEAVIEKSMSDIAKQIGMWYQSPVGTYPEIDRFAQDMMG